jgi:hypothetical protein
MLKCCAKCRGPRNRSNTYRNKAKKDGFDEYCKLCRNTYFGTYKKTNTGFRSTLKRCQKRYYNKHRAVIRAKAAKAAKTRNIPQDRDVYLRRVYGISQTEYDQMLANQGGVCAVCGKPPGARSLAVDHDHNTGLIRELLCHRCNTGIGSLMDDPVLVTAALLYLQKHAAMP